MIKKCTKSQFIGHKGLKHTGSKPAIDMIRVPYHVILPYTVECTNMPDLLLSVQVPLAMIRALFGKAPPA
jgi:hypothetical protein